MRALTIALVVAGLSNPLPNLIAQFKQATKPKPPVPAAGRLVLFVGLDISGSFMNGRYFDDSIHFLARYIYAHLKGYEGLEVPHSLFVGTIGGDSKEDVKTLYPIQTFEDRPIEQIEQQLYTIFPRKRVNPYTDFNSFFQQVADLVDARKLILKPLSIVLLTDGVPDLGGSTRNEKFRNLNLKPLEGLSRNITVRVLYTDAVTAKNWRDEVPRKRVKVWTQDAVVMKEWDDPRTMVPGKSFAEQSRFFSWLKDNVDFAPRLKPVE